MNTSVAATIHFTDRTSLTLRWPQMQAGDAATITSKVRQALDAGSLVAAVGNDLLVVPMQSVKYVYVTPAPSALPTTVILGASVEGGRNADDWAGG